MTVQRINELLLNPDVLANVSRRFWSKVSVRDGGCWPWLAKSRHVFGYGVLNTPGNKTVNAHALSWALANGPIPAGGQILHHCDNPSCCNPGHLYCGTNEQNRADMVARGRQRKGGHSLDTIQKIKAARAANQPRQTDAAKLARADAMRKRWQDPEWRSRFSHLMSGEKHPRFGKRPPDHQLEAVRKNHRSKNGYRHSEETKAKMRDAALRRRAL